MALSAKVGILTSPTGSEPQDVAVSGLGFAPKAVVFFANDRTSAGDLADYVFTIGWATGSSGERMVYGDSNDGAATGDCQRSMSTSKCGRWQTVGTSTILAEFEFKTMDSDGFTVTYTLCDAIARKVVWVAFGGSDITNQAVGNFTTRTTTGDTDIDLGWTPSMVLLLSDFSSAASADHNEAGGNLSLGCFTSSDDTEEWCVAGMSDLTTTMDTKRGQRTDHCLSLINTSGNFAVLGKGRFLSGATNGFRINYPVTVDGSARQVVYLAIAGGEWKAGKFEEQAGTGDQTVGSLGFQPEALMLGSFNNAANTAVQTHRRFSLGAGHNNTNRASIWSGDKDAIGTSLTNQNYSDTKVIRMMTEKVDAGSSPTMQAEADMGSTPFADGSFTINWSTNDGTSRELVYLAMGNTVAAGGQPTMRRWGGVTHMAGSMQPGGSSPGCHWG